MEKLRGIIEQHGRWNLLNDYIARIEAFIDTDFSFAIENAKSLLESIAKQICQQHQVVFKEDPKFRELLGRTFYALGLDANKDPEPSFRQGNHNRSPHDRGSTQSNRNCRTWQDAPRISECNEKIHHLTKDFLIDAVQMVASFFIRRFEAEFPLSNDPATFNKAFEYNEHPEFNENWDESFGEFSMGVYSYAASEILFAVDPQAYSTEALAFLRDQEE